MKERPILFSGEMVRAILAGRKTQTRRVVKPQPGTQMENVLRYNRGEWPCRYGLPGDRLWVRETWKIRALMGAEPHTPEEVSIIYRATEGHDLGKARYPWVSQPLPKSCMDRWQPSIFMPRWASRLSLEITQVRAQRLQDITEDDAEAEGVEIGGDGQVRTQWNYYRDAFACLWDSINAKRGYSWDTDPSVWVITFKVVQS